MFAWGFHYCVQLLPGVIFFKHSFTFSFAKAFFLLLSYFLSLEILTNAQFPKIYAALLKPNKKRHPNIFLGGSPWPTLIHDSMFVLGVHFCVQLLPVGFFFQTFPLPFPLPKFFFFYCTFFLFLSLEILTNSQFAKIYAALLEPNKKKHPNNFSRG